MDFNLSSDDLLAQKMFRDFTENEIKPIVKEMDETGILPMDIIEKMGELGMFGIPMPVEYGGVGSNYLTSAICVEEISKVCGAIGNIVSVQSSLITTGMYLYGTEEQKNKYLPDMAAGKLIGSMCLTEPGAGSDASAILTRAVKDGDNFVINGTKRFITNAGIAGVFYVVCVTDRSKGNKGITVLIVDRGTPGFTIGNEENLMGIRGSSTCELIFEDCVVPKENILGKEGEGLKQIYNLINGGRVTIGAQSLGIAQGAIDETVKYVKERKQFGKRISEFQNTQFKLAEMQTKADAARLLVYRAAVLKDEHKPYIMEGAMAKYYASEIANDITRIGVQLHGGYGYTKDYPIERMFRDAKITEIYEGANEIQKMVISGAMDVR